MKKDTRVGYYVVGVLCLVFSFATGALAQAPIASVSFVTSDTVTQGNWKGTYGTDGYSIANDSQSIPSYAVSAVQNQSNYTWASSTSDPRALQTGSGAGRIAATWYSASAFSFDVNLTDGGAHQIALYALDWDNYEGGRSENIQIADANTNTVLDSRNVSAFTNGIYLIWNVSGHVKINVTLAAGGNAVVSGLFFASPKLRSSAGFVAFDSVTQGNWKGTYGTDGYSIANDSQSIPSYAVSAVQNQSNYTWASSTSDPRALQTGSGAGRIAATWYSASAFSFDVNLTDEGAHQIALYALDWDNYEGGRSENIQIADANTNTVLDSRNVSAFTNGTYLIWNVSGHVTINVTLTAGGNAVISAIFFDTTSFTITGGSSHWVSLAWVASPSSATSGYNIYRSNISGSGYAKINSTAGLTYTDTTVMSGQTYYYVVTAIDPNGDESNVSNEVQEVIP